MDNLFIVFIVLVLTFYYVEKNKNRNIIEGMQTIGYQITCSINIKRWSILSKLFEQINVGPIWPITEKECIGQTGNNLDFLNITNKISSLENILINDNSESRNEKINSELTLSNHDIVRYQDNLYYYFGPDVSLNNDTGENMIKLPYIFTRR